MTLTPDPATLTKILARYREIKDHETGGIRQLAAELGVSYESVRKLLLEHKALDAPGRPNIRWSAQVQEPPG